MLSKEEIQFLFKAVEIAQQEYPRWRFGQTVFNVGSHLHQEIESLRGSSVDPFHNDDLVDDCIKAITEPDVYEYYLTDIKKQL